MQNVDTIIGIIVQDVDVESVHNLINTIRTDNQFPSILFHNRLNSMLLQKADLSQAQVTFLLYIINLFDIIFIGILPYMKNVYRYPLILVGEYWSDKKGTRYYQKIHKIE